MLWVAGHKRSGTRALFRSGKGGLLATFCCCGLALPAPASAQNPPAQPSAPTREEIERVPLRPPLRPAPQVSVEDTVERAPCALDSPAYRDIVFTLGEVAFDDLRGLPAEALRPAYAEYVGRQHNVAVICEIRDRAATILRDAGYIAAVEVPEQRIEDGIVRFQVLMARLTAIRVRGDAGRNERLIAAYLERLTEQEVFNRFVAERYLLLAGDIPGHSVRLALRSAGGARGEVVGEVTVERSPGLVDFNLQNFGSRELGQWGGLLRGELYGLTGMGDRTTIALFSTAELEEQQTLQLGHDFRLGSEGLTLSGQFTYAWAHPDLGNPAIDIRSRTLVATAEAQYPFVRSQALNVRGAAGFDYINQRIAFNGLPLNRDRLRVGFLRLDTEAIDRRSLGASRGFTLAEPRWRAAGSVELRQGFGIFGAGDPAAVPPSRLEGDATATLVRVSGFGEYRPVPAFTFSLGMRAQYSGNPLLSYEEYSVGNYTIGRGYDPGVLLGDKGIGVQAELRHGSAVPRARDAFAIQPFVFFDKAWVGNQDLLSPAIGPQDLSSAGGGVRVAYGDRARLEVALAVPLERAGLQTERGNPRLLVSLTTRLLPWRAQ